MGKVMAFPRHVRVSDSSQSSADTAPSVNALILSIAPQSGRTKRLRHRLTETRFRPTAAATSSSDRPRSAMKSDRCMATNVHLAHNSGQAECAPHVVDVVGLAVHHLHMGKVAKKEHPPKGWRPPKWRATCLRHWRGASGLSQEEVGAKVGLSHAQIQRYEAGISRPKEETLAKLKVLYGAPSIEAMLDGLPKVTDGESDAPEINVVLEIMRASDDRLRKRIARLVKDLSEP